MRFLSIELPAYLRLTIDSFIDRAMEEFTRRLKSIAIEKPTSADAGGNSVTFKTLALFNDDTKINIAILATVGISPAAVARLFPGAIALTKYRRATVGRSIKDSGSKTLSLVGVDFQSFAIETGGVLFIVSPQ
jgi:hypothetical protein